MTNRKVFIHTNNKQLLGAILAKYAIEKTASRPVAIEIINVDELEIFKKFAGKKYLRAGKIRTYDLADLQSFTLTRFMPPELMGFSGKAVVIDPDIFALVDINELFNMDMRGKAIACCRKNEWWDTSVMLLDCEKLKHWKIKDILGQFADKKLDYADLFALKKEAAESMIIEIPRIWNSLDELTQETKMLHTTNRLTQPWKTGLPIDFIINKMPKLFGFIPREPIHKFLGKYPTHYQPHPDKTIERFFFGLLRDTVKNGVITRAFVEKEISQGYIRTDALQFLS